MTKYTAYTYYTTCVYQRIDTSRRTQHEQIIQYMCVYMPVYCHCTAHYLFQFYILKLHLLKYNTQIQDVK